MPKTPIYLQKTTTTRNIKNIVQDFEKSRKETKKPTGRHPAMTR